MTNNSKHTGWSDIFGLGMKDPEDRNGFDRSAARINEIIQTEVDGGIPPNKIVVAGFSQGGAVALHVAMRSTHSLGGCVALSTWLPLREDYPAALSPAAATLPILQVCRHLCCSFGIAFDLCDNSTVFRCTVTLTKWWATSGAMRLTRP